jgi:hypothetical protein
MNSKKHPVMYSIGLGSIALALAFIILPNNNNAMAQQSSTTMTPNGPNSMMSMNPALQKQNWTGSIPLFSSILNAFKSKINTTLNDATTNAIKAVGGSNASAVAAFIHPENGFLVYDVFVLDSGSNIHKVIVDPGNGKVLSNQQMSIMEMMFMMHHRSMGMMGGPEGTGMMGSPNMMGGAGGSDMGMMGGP